MCNQCHEKMVPYDLSPGTLWVCTKAACPNFALLQVPMEPMKKFLSDNQKQNEGN